MSISTFYYQGVVLNIAFAFLPFLCCFSLMKCQKLYVFYPVVLFYVVNLCQILQNAQMKKQISNILARFLRPATVLPGASELLLIVGFCLLFLFSCNSNRRRLLPYDKHVYHSVLDSIRDIDSLSMMLSVYEKQKDNVGQMMTHRALGLRYRHTTSYTKALSEHTLALEIAMRMRDTLEMIDNLNNIGTNYRRLGMVDNGAESHYQALHLSELWSDTSTSAPLKQKVISLNGIGNAELTLNNLHSAEEAFRIALEGEKKLNSDIGQAINYANLGAIKELQGLPDSAFWYYECSLSKNRVAKSKKGIALCYNHFGRLAENREEWDAALGYYYRSYELMQDEEDRWHVMESCLSLARVYMAQDDMDNARRYLAEGWNTAEAMNTWEIMSEAGALLSIYEEKMGHAKKALEWHKVSDAYRDSVFNEKNRNHVQNLRDEYLRAHNDSELNKLRKVYEAGQIEKRMYIWIGTLIVVIATLAIVTLVAIIRVRNRSQKMMRNMEKVRTDFFTNITHEFRTPLTVMLGLGHQIAEGKAATDAEESRRIGAMIVRQGNSLLSLINQLLDIVKAENGIGAARWRTDNIVTYVSMIVENYREYALLSKVELSYVADTKELTMDFVPDYVKKILQNLLSNAIKYSRAGGYAVLHLKDDGQHLIVTVSDTGRGIAEKDLPHIFDAFYTATNCGVEVSAGVGLSMVRQMVTAMDGTVAVESTLGRGTTFTIKLPLKHGKGNWEALDTTEYIEPKMVVQEEVSMPVDDLEDTVKPCVLIIEDNQDVAEYIGMQLSDKYRICYAENGTVGLEKANEIMPDLVLTDLMMPGINGYEVCRRIRGSEVLNHIPIVIVSAKSTANDRVKGLVNGADAYLYKPFEPDELTAIVDNLIEQRKSLRQKFASSVKEGKVETGVLKPFEQEFLNKLNDLVYNKMKAGHVDSEILASGMCMSSSQLRRKVFAITGEKLSNFILQIRLSYAKKLLDTHADLPVGDVAARCGFEDAAYFSRIFKNMFQETPTQYRRRGNV